ncbi:hypothetical protein EKH55_5597 (plasmid) [Sinorhizobium alkalisoli]|nr:hypothetical protein EKH55_5597 [Sinorhizobium alkalisoli]
MLARLIIAVRPKCEACVVMKAVTTGNKRLRITSHIGEMPFKDAQVMPVMRDGALPQPSLIAEIIEEAWNLDRKWIGQRRSGAVGACLPYDQAEEMPHDPHDKIAVASTCISRSIGMAS